MTLPDLLARIVEHSRRRAVPVLLGGLALMLAMGWVGASRLGVSTDTDKLFSERLPWRQRQIAWDKQFPQFRNLLVTVIDADTPEQADETAAELTARLDADKTDFHDVTRPDASPYFDRVGLMLVDTAKLTDLLDQTIDAQPFLGQLNADPTARGLFGALGLIAQGIEHGQANLGPFAPALKAFDRTMRAALDGNPLPLSWQALLAGPLLEQAGQYRFVLAKPKLDFNALEPGGVATDALRADIAKLTWVAAGRARARVTGSVALADEEFATVAQGAAAGTIGSGLLVMLWLLLAVRSVRLIVPILLTLLLGLSVTIGFAALAVGTLNLISVAFAILFVGIAVDFAIQFSVRYRAARFARPRDPAAALDITARMVGPQILVAASATAAGFLAFVPTSFKGVGELGLIAGFGMLAAFACTLVFLPAALTIMRPRPERGEIGFPAGNIMERRLRRVRPFVLGVFGALGVLGLLLIGHLRFDSDPLHTKDPTTEAMRTLTDLMGSPFTNPYTIDILRPTLAEADALAVRLRKLPLVADALTLSSFVPADQPAKLALLADARDVLAPTLAPLPRPAQLSPIAIRIAAKAAADSLDRVLDRLPPDDPLRPVAADLRALATASDDVVMTANQSLTRFLRPMLERLRTALQAAPVTAADVPPGIARDWRLPDGQARVQVLARAQARDSAGLHALVQEVRTVAPDAGGSAVGIVETAATIVGAFSQAALFALVAIAVILALVLRRALDVALVMGPLLLSALMTVVVCVALPLPLNFANVIALPLLLGVGVSFNIYFVMNWRAGTSRFLGTATARAIVFSALTTGTAFGTLALSQHPGTSSMGQLLLLSLGCTLVASLVFVPTLLNRPPRAAPARPDLAAPQARPRARNPASVE